MLCAGCKRGCDFYPRSPCGERHCQGASKVAFSTISIHALLAESDNRRRAFSANARISIHALLAESDHKRLCAVCCRPCISIHALLAESDVFHSSTGGDTPDISIHALLAESDVATRRMIFAAAVFLSTLSLRRATAGLVKAHIEFDFYPRSPCGERLGIGWIHGTAEIFLSTLSLRRATLFPLPPDTTTGISIHALLAESDSRRDGADSAGSNFYPRSPCGERLAATTIAIGPPIISIHALLAESDTCCGRPCSAVHKFLSTLSLRRATQHWHTRHHRQPISIHALLAESDEDIMRGADIKDRISIHALLAESDLYFHTDILPSVISIHALLAESDVQTLLSLPAAQ